jgi:hypothetical protein
VKQANGGVADGGDPIALAESGAMRRSRTDAVGRVILAMRMWI